MKMGCLSITHQTVWRFVSFTVIIASLLGECAVNRGTSCPVYQDLEWQRRDGKCEPGKKYHCFENEGNGVKSDGCYIEKICKIGAHPVVDFNHIRCDYCQTGFQPQEKLRSSTYVFSSCERHSAPCKAEYGQTQCRAGTRELDRACTCNASLGFSPRIDGEDCDCFTPNDACSGCKFRGCPDGTVKNSRGVCGPVPVEIPIHTPPPGSHTEFPSAFSTTTRAHVDSTELQGGEIAAIVISIIVVVIGAAVLVVFCVRKKWHKRILHCCDDDVNPESKNGTASEDSRNPMIPQNGNPCSIEEEHEEVAPEDSLDSRTPRIAQNGVNYIHTEVLRIPENANIHITADSFLIANEHRVITTPYTLQRTPDARNPSTSRCGPPPVSVSSATPSTETPCEREQPLPTPQSAHVPADLPATYSPLPGPAALPPLPEPSAPPPSIPDPSAPPPSILDPSAPPPSILDPSAPPPSILDPSAPPPSIHDPSAPLPSLPDPLLSLHAIDQSLMEDEGNPGEIQQSDDDETQRKLPHISHHSEAGEVCQSEVDETVKKLPYSGLDRGVDVVIPLSSSLDQRTPSNEMMETAFNEQQSVNGKAGPVSVTCGDGALPREMKPVYRTHTDEEEINFRSCRTDVKSRMSGSEEHAGRVHSQATDDDRADVVLNPIT